MTVQETSDELGIRYLLAIEQLQAAKLGLAQSVTVTQQESADTWLRRAAAHAHYCQDELLSHCAHHDCPVPVPSLEQAGILRPAALPAADWAEPAAA
jgi:hypothetical protein